MPTGYPTAAEAAAVSPTSPAWAPQDHLDPLLQAHLSDLPSARLWLGVEVEDVRQDADGVTVSERHADRGRMPVRARYVTGADGSHSTTRSRVHLREAD